jgi:colanic acid/amylovoran biosynthesis glycosyltransferase
MGQDIASSKKCGISGHLVTMFHGVDIRLGLERGGQIYQELFDTGELFLSISEYNKTNLLAFGVPSEKLMTLPVGIFPELFKSNNSKTTDPVKIITVARLVHEKGIEFGIRAVDMLLKRNPHFNLQYTIVGAGCLEQSLKQLVSELKLENSIIFCGAKNQQEVRDLLADSNLFLLPSIAEALPVSIMEAHAAELPVVASNVGSVNQLVIDGQSGFIVEPKDVAGLSNKLEYLIQHPHIWTEFGVVGRNHISLNYNNTLLCKKLIEFFQFLL